MYKILFIVFSFVCMSLATNVFGSEHTDAQYGIYTGSFDPPTLAHKQLILNAINNFKLKKLYIMVNRYSSEKTYKAGSKERAKMLELMLHENKDRISIIIQQSYNKGRDLQLLKYIVNAPIVQITGEDSYVKLLNIPKSSRIPYDKIAIIERPANCITGEVILKPILERHATYMKINDDVKGICSGKVRDKLAERIYEGLQIEDNVVSYIKLHDLYSKKSVLQEKIAAQEYNLAFKEFIHRISLQDNTIEIPEFNAIESKASWQDKFEKWHYSVILRDVFKYY